MINTYGLLLVSRACLGIALAGIFTAINVLKICTEGPKGIELWDGGGVRKVSEGSIGF